MRMANKAILVLVVVLAFAFALILGISSVKHGNSIRKLETRVENLENFIVASDENKGVSHEDLAEIENRLTAMVNDPELTADRLMEIEAEIEALKAESVATDAYITQLNQETSLEMSRYLSHLQMQIDYLRRWAENQGYNPDILYNDPDVTTPDEWSDFDEDDELDDEDESDD